MIRFTREDDKVLLRYTSEIQGNWIEEAITKRPSVILKKTFTLWRELHRPVKRDYDVDNIPDIEEMETSSFSFAILKDDYFKIIRGILIEDNDIYFHKDIELRPELFVADAETSVFSVMKDLYKGDVYIGGKHPEAIPVEAYEELLEYFPSNYERRKYVEARVAGVLRNYFENVKDAEKSYHKFLNKKLVKKGTNLVKTFKEYEEQKFTFILDRLKKMLAEEEAITEAQWQEQILQIILLLYPKYIHVFREVPVYSRYNNLISEKSLDFLLVDNNGNVDIIEIKKPFGHSIMTRGMYRNNFIPLRELSGAVMQVEKYVYYLNRWSEEGEKFLTTKYKEQLPEGFNIQITNPSGIIIMGRENNLSDKQKLDFEVVKRKYKNVADIITYDNLIERLSSTINRIRRM